MQCLKNRPKESKKRYAVTMVFTAHSQPSVLSSHHVMADSVLPLNCLTDIHFIRIIVGDKYKYEASSIKIPDHKMIHKNNAHVHAHTQN